MKYKIGDEVLIIEKGLSEGVIGIVSLVRTLEECEVFPYRVTHKWSGKEGELFKEEDLVKLTKLHKVLK